MSSKSQVNQLRDIHDDEGPAEIVENDCESHNLENCEISEKPSSESHHPVTNYGALAIAIDPVHASNIDVDRNLPSVDPTEPSEEPSAPSLNSSNCNTSSKEVSSEPKDIIMDGLALDLEQTNSAQVSTDTIWLDSTNTHILTRLPMWIFPLVLKVTILMFQPWLEDVSLYLQDL
jgi:hypothetical protein